MPDVLQQPSSMGRAELEGSALGSDDREVAPVERCDLGLSEPLCHSHDRGVHRSQGQVPVPRHKLGHTQPVCGYHRLGDQASGCEITEESHLAVGAEAGPDQIGDLGHHEHRDDQRTGVGLEEIEAGAVVAIIAVDVGVQEAGIDDQGDDPTSSAMIDSIRSEMSENPDAPEPAARSLRRPPRRPR